MPQTFHRNRLTRALVFASVFWAACSGSSPQGGVDASRSTGGATGAGGDKGTGGALASGGATSAGGAVGSGGAASAGGTIGSGGARAGGATGTGGGSASGGARTGGMSGAGGALGSGGVTGTGGAPALGGAAGTAGIIGAGGAATGGTTGTGTAPAKGGASGTGGTTATRDAGGTAGAGDAGPDLARGDASPNRGTDATYPAITGKPTVYLAGDSTVQTYAASQAPQQGWGQRIAELFSKDVAFVNKSIGGRSSKSFIDEGRLTEILGLIKAGDYLFAQWGINDRYTSDPARYTNPATTFRTYLKQYIDGARGKNAFPVLITPTPRLDYTGGVFQNGFVDYCAAIKAVGLETNTPVIDLQTMGLALYTRLGYDAVVNTISLAGPDVLHFRDTGAYQMARLVAQGVSDIAIPISAFVLQDMLAGP